MAKSTDECFAAIRELISKEDASDHEIRGTLDQLDQIKQRLLRQGDGFAGGKFTEAAKQVIDEFRYQSFAQRKQALENQLKIQRLDIYSRQKAFEKDPVEAVRGKLLGGTLRLSQGGDFSVMGMKNSLVGVGVNNLTSALREAGLDTIMQKGMIDRDVLQELYELRKGGEPGSTKNPEARAAAKIIKAANDTNVSNLQRAGSPIRPADGYMIRTIHSRDAVSAVPFEEWATQVAKNFDLEKSFPTGGAEESLRETYDKVKQGTWGTNVEEGVSDQFLTVSGMTGNLGKKTSRSRTLIPKDGANLYEYNEKFGEKNVLESTLSAIQKSSGDAALMYHLGTNPEATFQAWKKRLAGIHQENPGALDKLKENDTQLDQFYDTARGLSNTPGTSMLARTGQFARALETVSKLGNVVFVKTNELAVSAANARAFNGKNLLENTGDLVSNFLSALTNKTERDLWSKRLGTYMDDQLGELHSMIGADSYTKPGVMVKMQRAFGSLSGLRMLTAASRSANARLFAEELADHTDSTWTDLNPNIRAGLERYDFDERTWNTIRQRAVQDIGNGRTAITPEAIRAIPDDFFGAGAKQAKFDAEVRLVSYLNGAADTGSLTPGGRQKAFLLRGTTDEGLGIGLRLVSQFKQVPLLLADIPRQLLLSNPSTAPATLREAIFQGKGDFSGLTQFAIMATGLAYISTQAKNYVTGAAIENPQDPKTWLHAMVRGGAAGLYADLFFGEFNKNYGRTALDFLAGPTVGAGADIATLLSETLHGQGRPKENAQQAVSLLWNHVPFHNLFYLKKAMDYTFMNRLNETLRPGYLNRLDQKSQDSPNLFGQPSSMLGGQ